MAGQRARYILSTDSGHLVSQPSSPQPMFGRYELVAHLATGGMAEIFLARERGLAGLERLVVIKRILPKLAGDASFVDMFLREARIIARLNHPNVIQIFELGEENGNYYIAMEYIHGSTVREMQVLAEKAGALLPVEVTCSIIEQAARGLHAAHELRGLDGNALGVIHRDMSPHNLMCNTEGFVKVLDFGVAKASRGVEATHSGHLKGKFAYMSPEQCQGLKLDRRADVFALGIVTWESLTGKRLFKREKDLDMMRAVVQEDSPPPSQYNPLVPAELDRVVLGALHKDRQQRYQSAEIFRTELLQACRARQIHYGEDVIAHYLHRIAGTELQARQATLREALERTLTSNERLGLLHQTGSGSRSSRAAAQDDGAKTVVEGARARAAKAPATRSMPARATSEDATPPTPTRSHLSASNHRLTPPASNPAQPFSAPASPSPHAEPARRDDLKADDIAQPLAGAAPAPLPASRARRPLIGLLAGLLGVGLALLAAFALWARSPDDPTERAEDAGARAPILLGEPLKIGWAPIAPRELLAPEIDQLTPYLERTMERPIENEITPTYEALSLGLQNGDYDIAMLPPLLYVQTQAQAPDIQFLALRQFGGATSSDALLVTRMDSSMRNLEELKGKVFCFTDRDSTTGYFLPRAYLRRHGYDPDLFVKKVVWSGDHIQVLRDLLEGKCDVAATYSGSYLSADAFGVPITRIRIFAVAGHVPQDTVAARPTLPASVANKLRDALLAFDPQKEFGVAEIGKVLRTTGFSAGSDADFEDLRESLKYQDAAAPSSPGEKP